MATYSKDYDRSMRHAVLVEGSGKARDALHGVVQSMFAITNMLRALLVEGEDRRELAEGVYHLLDQQCAMLNGVFEELGAEQEERDALDEANGTVRQSRIPTEALNEPARKLRLQFIEANAKAGVDHGLIGAALNLSGDDIARVVGQLRGEAAPRRQTARVAQA